MQLSKASRGPEATSFPEPPVNDTALSPTALESIVDAYFINLHNQPYSFFHEGSFRQRLADGGLPDHLILAVMASAVCFCQHSALPSDRAEAASAYASKSWKSIISSYFTASKRADIFIVQTMALLALFDFTGKSTVYSAFPSSPRKPGELVTAQRGSRSVWLLG